jgi:hypothetical protein
MKFFKVFPTGIIPEKFLPTTDVIEKITADFCVEAVQPPLFFNRGDKGGY